MEKLKTKNSNCEDSKCFNFLFNIPDLIDKSYFESLNGKKIPSKNFLCDCNNINNLKSIKLKCKVSIEFDHTDKKMEFFSIVSNLYWSDKDKYLKLMENLLINSNKHKIDFVGVDKMIKSTEKSIEILNSSIDIGFIESKVITDLVENVNQFLKCINYKKLKISETNLYAFNQNKLELKNLYYKDYDINIIDSSNISEYKLEDDNAEDELNQKDENIKKNSEKRFYTKNINESNDVSYLKDLLKYINSIYQSYPFDKQLIGIQNEIIKKIIILEKN